MGPRQRHPRYTDARKGRPWVAHNTIHCATNAHSQKDRHHFFFLKKKHVSSFFLHLSSYSQCFSTFFLFFSFVLMFAHFSSFFVFFVFFVLLSVSFFRLCFVFLLYMFCLFFLPFSVFFSILFLSVQVAIFSQAFFAVASVPACGAPD